MSVTPQDEHALIGVHDRVINNIFGSGMTLAAILNLDRVDHDVADRLRDVIAALDTAVAELRTEMLARVLASFGAPSEVSQTADPNDTCRRLSRFAVEEVFAYAVGGHDFYRSSDHELWAHESDGILLSARSGVPFARRDGHVFYDIDTDAPLYYETTTPDRNG